MFKLSKSRLVRIAAVVITMLFIAPQADAAYSWGTSSVVRSGSTMGYGNGKVTGQFLQITSNANTRATGALNGRGVYSNASAYQLGSNGQTRNFSHPNTSSTSYQATTMKSSYSDPTYPTWYAKGRVCVDVAWSPDSCSSWTTVGTVY